VKQTVQEAARRQEIKFRALQNAERWGLTTR
jgi:hypothetical protein